jgi:hypothetical protein
MAHELAFVLCSEAGYLESRAALLIESIRRFGGRWADAPVWVVQPRAGRCVSPATRDRYVAQGAVVVAADLNRAWQSYGFGNKIYATAFIESLVEGSVGTLAFLDSDLIFLQAPEELVLDNGHVVAATAVSGTGVGLPSGEAANDYWDRVFDVCGVDRSRLWDVSTIVEESRIRAYFNAGLLCARPSAGLFRRWRDNLERWAGEGHRDRYPQGTKEFSFVDQALFAGTVMANFSEDQVKILDWRYNYPLGWRGEMGPARRAEFLDDLVAVHYHRTFDDLEWTKKMQVREPFKSWLLQRLPLDRAR